MGEMTSLGLTYLLTTHTGGSPLISNRSHGQFPGGPWHENFWWQDYNSWSLFVIDCRGDHIYLFVAQKCYQPFYLRYPRLSKASHRHFGLLHYTVHYIYRDIQVCSACCCRTRGRVQSWERVPEPRQLSRRPGPRERWSEVAYTSFGSVINSSRLEETMKNKTTSRSYHQHRASQSPVRFDIITKFSSSHRSWSKLSSLFISCLLAPNTQFIHLGALLRAPFLHWYRHRSFTSSYMFTIWQYHYIVKVT